MSGREEISRTAFDAREEMARVAFKSGDPELSREVHDRNKIKESAFGDLKIAPESHLTGQGTYLKSAVFGGLDGIVTTFSVVARFVLDGDDEGLFHYAYNDTHGAL